eukprot:2174822-Pyramimonas_sp.AAC.1
MEGPGARTSTQRSRERAEALDDEQHRQTDRGKHHQTSAVQQPDQRFAVHSVDLVAFRVERRVFPVDLGTPFEEHW